MRFFEMPHFKKFSRSHMGARDYVVYRLQVNNILLDVKDKGLLTKNLTTQDGEACITYYYYKPEEKTLYVLAGHLQRKGEPKDDEIKAVERYVRQIEGGTI